MKCLVLFLALAGAAVAEECPIADISLVSVGPEDSQFDAERSRAVVTELIGTAMLDALFEPVDPHHVGSGLAQLGRQGAPKPVAYEVRSLAIRLRQLDCAVRGGSPSEGRYQALIEDLEALLVRLGGPRFPSPPPLPGVVHSPATPPKTTTPAHVAVSFKSRALGYRIGGGSLVGGGIVLLATALALTAQVSTDRPPPPCTTSFCLNGLYEPAHQAMIAGAVSSWILGAAATVAGGILLHKGARWAEKAQLAPLVSVGPAGASAGVRFDF
jgi:hypothetical protein